MDVKLTIGHYVFFRLLAGFTIFAVLGNLAHQQGTDVDKVVSGAGGAG